MLCRFIFTCPHREKTCWKHKKKDNFCLQTTLSVRGTPKPSPKLQRKESGKSQRSWLGVFRNRDDNKSLVDSQSDSEEADLNEEANNKKSPNNSRRNSMNNYRYLLLVPCSLFPIFFVYFWCQNVHVKTSGLKFSFHFVILAPKIP